MKRIKDTDLVGLPEELLRNLNIKSNYKFEEETREFLENLFSNHEEIDVRIALIVYYNTYNEIKDKTFMYNLLIRLERIGLLERTGRGVYRRPK